jgi:hypothetical protein
MILIRDVPRAIYFQKLYIYISLIQTKPPFINIVDLNPSHVKLGPLNSVRPIKIPCRILFMQNLEQNTRTVESNFEYHMVFFL